MDFTNSTDAVPIRARSAVDTAVDGASSTIF